MNKELLLYKAIKIAEKAHRKQVDKYGAPYNMHVMRVMNFGKTLDEKIVGILHDVIEYCPEYSYDFLRKKGFSEEQIFAIECLTKIIQTKITTNLSKEQKNLLLLLPLN